MNSNFQKHNNIVGWFVFAIALITYWITMEETASYWDCGEFIAVSYKLEVPHPPGAPLFLLIGRLFSFLAMGDLSKVAYWINFSSVLASAFAVLFLFWSIVLFGRKMMKINSPEELTSDKTWVLMGAGIVGALSYTYCDSAWFSAVEAEVYGMSSFFTAIVVWAMLKWDVIEDESKANRWLLFIFYMMGLSIGVHLLNLVTIPALALIFYFKKYTPSFWGAILAMIISLFIVIFINDFIIPGLPSIAAQFEIFFVNSLGLPFGAGAITFALILIGGLVYGIMYTQRTHKVIWNTFLNSIAFILIGYASYALVVIRSNDNPPIDENDPSDVMSFVSYLKREQYGSRPLLYGPYFTAQPVDYKQGPPIYMKGKDKYEIKDRKGEYVYNKNDQTILPRIYSSDPDHASIYRDQLGLQPGQKPTFGQNLQFMFQYQIGHMYIRYFFFNFVGRESDNQGANWLTPSQWFEKLPPVLAENKGRNNFFAIPFVLGLIGMFYQSITDTKNLVVVGLLFILTGIALVIYLNTPPTEPRERDYIYAGSYYAYCFWIGFAVIAIADATSKWLGGWKKGAVIGTILCLSAPILMAKDGWDDHDRSNRYFSVDSAVNYLQSCAPNAILFSGGDNDTFPLWYAQEVEEVRQDVRVVVLSYYNTDWYIKQTAEQHYTSAPFPYTLTEKNYQQGGLNDYLPYNAEAKVKQMDLKKFLEFIRDENKNLIHRGYGDKNMLPTKEILLKIDVEKVRQMGIVPKEFDSLIVPQLRLRVKGNVLEKKDLAMLDLLATSDWSRPIYVNNTSLSQFGVDLTRCVIQEGNAFRILPIHNPLPNVSVNDIQLVNTEVAKENMMKKFQYRNLNDSSVYYSEDYRKFVYNHRSSLNSLVEALLVKGDTAGAREVLMFSLDKIPDAAIRYDFASALSIGYLLEVGEKEKALKIADVMAKRADDVAAYYISKSQYNQEVQESLTYLNIIHRTLYKYGEMEAGKKIEEKFDAHAGNLQRMNPGM